MVVGSAVVRVAPELRFLLAPRHRDGEVRVVLDGTSSLGHVVESLGVPRTEVGRLLVSGDDGGPAGPETDGGPARQESDGGPAGPGTEVEPSYRPADGDVVDVQPVRRPQPVPAHRYLLDVHLGALARRMRLVGLDTAYRNDADDAELVAEAEAQERVLLTRDRGLLRRRALTAGAYVRGDRADDQLADVLDRFAPELAPWTRCLACNGRLEPVPVERVAHLLEPGTLRTYDEFSRCLGCGRAYWRGAHARRLAAVIDRALSRP